MFHRMKIPIAVCIANEIHSLWDIYQNKETNYKKHGKAT